MTNFETAGNSSQTLAQRLTQGRIPVSEGLRYAMSLAEALRKIHDAGHVHGAVSPSSIGITRTGLELLPALGSAGSITPYTAPEVVQGRPADSRSDIFSFGTILYEMLTGRRAFAGEGDELTAAILNSPPAPSGSPAVDRLVASCLAKDPGARWQRMQKLLLELKLLAVAVQRAESPATRREVPDPTPAIRAEVQQAEARLVARMAKHEEIIATLQERLGQATTATGSRFDGLERGIESISGRIGGVEQSVAGTGNRLQGLEQGIESFHGRIGSVEQSVAGTGSRLDGLEAGIEGIHGRVGSIELSVVGTGSRLQGLEQGIESVSGRMGSVEQSVAGTGSRLQGLEHGIEGIHGRVGSVEQSVAGTGSRMDGLEAGIEGIHGRISGVEQSVGETHSRVDGLEHGIASIQERVGGAENAVTRTNIRVEGLEQGIDAVRQDMAALRNSISRIEQALSVVVDRAERLEHASDSGRQDTATLRAAITEELALFEKALKSQSTAIESARTAMAQTDDLVERVVEALESLQSVVLENADERAAVVG